MTKASNITYIAAILIMSSLVGVTIVQASEVTGTLSSDATADTQASGNITGTVTSESTGGSSSGGSSGGRSNRSSNSADTPAGAVLGVSTDDTVVPGFPNAGFASEDDVLVPTLWSRILHFFSMTVSAVR